MRATALVVILAVAPACLPRAQMCAAESECGSHASCVAGRCVGHGAVAAISAARRTLVEPVDVAWVGRDEVVTPLTPGALGASSAPTVRLGRGDGGVLLLRFAADLPAEVTVLEAYVVLERATDVDADPTPVSLHAARIAEPWDSQSVSWALRPRIDEVGAPVTRVVPSSGPLVRLDVRDLVHRWRRRHTGEFGIAVVAAGRSATGLAFLLRPDPRGASGSRRDPALDSFAGGAAAESASGPVEATSAGVAALGGPVLELYVK